MNIKEIFSNKPRCQHISKIGSRCQADPQTGKSYCFFHDPDQKKKQAEARKAGGEARSRQTGSRTVLPADLPILALENNSAVADLMIETINQFRRGEMDNGTARTIGYLTTLLLRVRKEDALKERLASGQAARPGKKPRYDHVRVNIIPAASDFDFDSDGPVPGMRTVSTCSPPPSRQDKPEDKAKPEAKQDQGKPSPVSPEYAASANQHNQPNQTPQRNERILPGPSPFPQSIIPEPENKAAQHTSLKHPDPRNIRTL
jgi:hypothetical protein